MASATVPATDNRTDIVPPHNLDAEAGLIAACILDGTEMMSMVLESRLRPDSFYKPAHQIIFQILCDLYSAGSHIDEIVVGDRLESRNVESMASVLPWLKQQPDKQRSLLELVGGFPALNQLTLRIETSAHARYWMEIVREKWLLRRLIATTRNILDEAYSNQDQLSHFLEHVEQEIFSINEDRITDSATTIASAVDTASNMISKILSGGSEHGVLTGLKDLDGMTFGLHPGEMIVLAARPSMGKTSLAMNIAENAALPRQGNGARTLVFSLEMGADQLAMRMLCGRAKVNMKRVRDRMISKDQMRQLAEAAKELKHAPIVIDDSSNLTILELRAKARRIHARQPLNMIMIDYLQLISGTDNRVPREQQISEISRGIKAMAKELSVPVLVLSQLNRSSEKENRRPRASDLRESGSIEQDADVVLLLASPEKSDDNPSVPQAARERDLIIAKQRNGPTGDVQLTFIPEFTRFENYTREPDI